MKIQFLGAAGTVTGSKFLLEARSGKRALIDCGLFQGIKRLRLRNWESFPVAPDSIEFVVLTHAHLDHSGYLPKFVKEGFRGPIFCSPATFDLTRILLLDSAKIMEEDAAYANKAGFSKHHPALPLYDSQDVENALRLFRPVPFGEQMEVGEFAFELRRAGHILGAAHVRVEAEGASVAFSGDLGRSNDLLMKPPEPLLTADYLVLESTYGDRVHPEESPALSLEKVIRATLKRGGSVLIPAFAVGRAQSLVFAIAELKRQEIIPNVPVFLDSPMAIEVTDLYRKFPEDHRLTKEQCAQLHGAARYIRTADESKWLTARSNPRIIISASGMATGGRVLHHLKAMAGKKENTILFSGFQAVGTRGANLLAGAPEIKIHGSYVPIRCRIEGLENFSAHADSREILSWIQESGGKPKTCFVVHGEPAASDALRLRLQDAMGLNVVVPTLEESFELSRSPPQFSAGTSEKE